MMARTILITFLAGLLGGGNVTSSTAVRPRLAPVYMEFARFGPVSAAGRYRWPVDGAPTVVRGFEPPAKPWLPGHRGVDLDAAPSTRVLAAGTGVVVFAGMVAGRPVVSVEHAGGLRTTYEPVLPVVRAGQRVDAGTVLGTLLAGHAGCPTAACLHWGLRAGEVYLDPLSLLSRGRVRLLPL
jgi:murein DD-endopeptidase MepM/ murein hydrolase activator NlpD